MKRFLQFTLVVFFFSGIVSCQKSPGESLLAPEIQRIKEEDEVLLPYEFLEHGGIRFKINYPPGTAAIGLKLFKVLPTRTEIPLGITTEFENYYIESKDMAENSDFILAVEYKTVAANGAFDLEVIGFTSINLSKEFTLSNNPYATSNAGTSRDFLKIRKGINKYSFYKL